MAIGGFFLFWWLVGAWIVASISTFMYVGEGSFVEGGEVDGSGLTFHFDVAAI